MLVLCKFHKQHIHPQKNKTYTINTKPVKSVLTFYPLLLFVMFYQKTIITKGIPRGGSDDESLEEEKLFIKYIRAENFLHLFK